MRRLLITTSLAVSSLLAATGCAVGRPDQAPPRRVRAVTSSPLPPAPSEKISAGKEVHVTKDGPLPHQLVAGTGETITWRNETAKTISVGLIDGSRPSGDILPGDAYTHVFDTAGSFAYRIGKPRQPAGVVEILPQANQEPAPTP
jgi:plastocyanin